MILFIYAVIFSFHEEMHYCFSVVLIANYLPIGFFSYAEQDNSEADLDTDFYATELMRHDISKKEYLNNTVYSSTCLSPTESH